MGSSSKTTKVNMRTDPWTPAQPALKEALSGASDAYANTYNGVNVAGMDANVTAGQDQILANANAGTIGNLAGLTADNLGSILGNGGYAEGQREAQSGIMDSLGVFNDQNRSIAANLDPYANGSMIGNNPYLQKAIQDSMEQASTAANRQFSAAGRYGSGAHADTLGTSLGRIATDANMNAWNIGTQNQLAANGQLANLSQMGMNGNLAGYGASAGMGQQAYANSMTGLNGLGLLSTAQNTDAANKMAIGGQRMDYNQALIDDANQSPWTKVGNLAQIAGGIGSLGSQTQGVTKETTNNGVAGVIGAVAGGLGGIGNLASGLGKVGGWSGLFGMK